MFFYKKDVFGNHRVIDKKEIKSNLESDGKKRNYNKK